jgi:hypothetical protein
LAGARLFPARPTGGALGGGGRAVGKRRLKLGDVGELTPDEARQTARMAMSRVRLGGDPAAERSAGRRQITVAALVEEFITDHVEAKRKPNTAANYAGILQGLVVPEIGPRKVDTITRATLARMHLALKTTPYRANSMVAIVGAMYGYAQSKHIVPEGFRIGPRALFD